MKFSEKLVRLRKIRGITQDEFASAVGVSRQAVYKWESGQSYPEVAKLLEIKLLFGISIDDLLDESYEIALPEKKKRKRKTVKPEAAAAVAEEAPITAEEPEVKTEEETAPVVAEEPEATEPVEESAPTAPEAPTAPVAEDALEEVMEIPTPADAEVKEEKKKGFFSRLFGRK